MKTEKKNVNQKEKKVTYQLFELHKIKMLSFNLLRRWCLVKKVLLEISQNHRKTPVQKSFFFSKVADSSLEVFLEKGALKIYNKFKGEHPCRSVISIEFLCIFSCCSLLVNMLENMLFSSRENMSHPKSMFKILIETKL